jgi:hypothetical protein
MLLFATVETWIVTIWQPDSMGGPLVTAIGLFFAFPYMVRPFRTGWGWLRLAIGIGFGVPIPNLYHTLFILEPPVVFTISERVFWEIQTRLLAFRIIFSFHLVALWLLLLILVGVDIIKRRFHVRGVSKHPKAALEGFSRSSEEGRTNGSVT